MRGTIDGFGYGLLTPVAAFVMACLGGALGLRCVVRSVLDERSSRPGWLALGAVSIGCGIWTMHFIAMIGFRVEETPVRYDVSLTVLSLAVAVAVVGIGVFAVGYRGVTAGTLCTAGAVTGLGVAAMHYIGMAALQLSGSIRYDTPTVALSVVIAIVAATTALWAAVSIRGFLTSLGASLVMGVAVSGMHYTGMAAVSVHLHDTTGPRTGESPVSLLLPMLIGPVIFLVLAGAIVMLDPPRIRSDKEPARPRRGRPTTTDGPDGVDRSEPSPSLFEPSRSPDRHPQGRQGAGAPGVQEW
ncbi:MHYT domain-containing protein [Streptomyces phyllanthi]|uniref:MHYT domain-containing protein n=1 Tax=Streptomyces phyllanthi TaxID=1803180 RepID=A0A5N8WJ50_9ACTN|nr:MHYT domain-containing protein [Streptomyces phyllanthi]MPY46886.1 hypothetical protein [Streptomyces phyllanthi]